MEHRDRDTQGGYHGMMEAEIGMVCPTSHRMPRIIGNTKSQENDMEQSFPYSLQTEYSPSDNFRALASRSIIKEVSVVVYHLVCGTLFQQPWETNTRIIYKFLIFSSLHSNGLHIFLCRLYPNTCLYRHTSEILQVWFQATTIE